MTDQPRTLDVKEALHQIEEALDWANGERTDLDFSCLDRAKKALASLRSMLEGDVGEDEVELDSILHTLRIKRFNQDDWQDVEHIDRARKLAALLSAKAKIGEAELKEAKREVLEKVRGRLLAHRWLGDDGQIAFLNRVIDQEIKHTAPKEAGK